MRNDGQVYQTKQCKLCLGKLEPNQPGEACWLCDETIRHLGPMMRTASGLFAVMQEITRRTEGVDTRRGATNMASWEVRTSKGTPITSTLLVPPWLLSGPGGGPDTQGDD